MKAIQMHGYGGVDQLRYEDVPAPRPGPGEVLVKVASTSVNPIDWKIRRGDLRSTLTLHFPLIPGRDIAGEVVETGADVSQYHPGQPVMALAGRSYAEFAIVAAKVLAALPPGLDLQRAGALPLILTTGGELIARMRPLAGETLLVTGALGNVGRTAVHAAIRRGAHVLAGVRAAQREPARSLGASQIVAIDVDSEINALPPLDAIADTVGGSVIAKLLSKLKPGGVLGSVLGKPPAAEGRSIRVETFSAQPDTKLLAELAAAVAAGQLDIPISRTLPLREAPEAQRIAEAGQAQGKIVLIP